MSGCFGVVAGLSHGLLRQVLDEKEQREPATAFFFLLFFCPFFSHLYAKYLPLAAWAVEVNSKTGQIVRMRDPRLASHDRGAQRRIEIV